MIYLAPYGTAWTLRGMQLVDRSTGQYKVAPTLAVGDVKIEKDGGAAANLATLPSVAPPAGSSLDVPFSAAEMQCKQAVLRFVDAAGAEWNDDCLHIFTCGDPNAFFAFNFFTPTVGLSIASQGAVAGAVWDELRANHTVPATFGEGVASVQGDVTGNVDGSIASVGALGAGAITAASIATGAIDADAIAQDAAQEIADEVLNRNIAGGGSGATRNVRNALRGLRNRVRNNGGTLEVYEEDDTTIAWSATLTTAAGNPITEVDP